MDNYQFGNYPILKILTNWTAMLIIYIKIGELMMTVSDKSMQIHMIIHNCFLYQLTKQLNFGNYNKTAEINYNKLINIKMTELLL